MNRYLLLIIFILSINILYSQPEPGMPSEPGKCYAKCLIQETFQTTHTLYLSMDDKVKESVLSVSETIVAVPATQKWVKKLADKNCLSKDPNDCLVWCLVEDEAVLETLTVVTENKEFHSAYLNNPSSFSLKNVKIKTLESEGGFTEWKAVICGDADNYDSIVSQVQSELAKRGYDTGTTDNQMGAKTKAALIKYQKSNELPVGNLDYETLESLGISVSNTSSTNENIQENKIQEYNHCNFYLQAKRKVNLDTLYFTSIIYLGKKINRLDFVDYIDQSKIRKSNYDITNPRQGVAINNKYDKLLSKSPQDFEERENTVIESIAVREGGVQSFGCLCPDSEQYLAFQIEVENALEQLGYEVDGNFDETTQRSLATFQIKYNRPVGVIDLGTLDLLGIGY